jgi:hypothetical protein
MLAVLLMLKDTAVPAQIAVALLADILTVGVDAVPVSVMVLPVAFTVVKQPVAFETMVTYTASPEAGVE